MKGVCEAEKGEVLGFGRVGWGMGGGNWVNGYLSCILDFLATIGDRWRVMLQEWTLL